MDKQASPMIVTRGGLPGKNGEGGIQCIKYILFASNLIFFVLGCALLGICIWMVVDRTFIQFISGNALYAAAIYIAMGASIVILFISFIGLIGALSENKFMLMVYCGVVAFMFLLLLICVILAGVFSGQIGSAIHDKMEETLKNNYGIDFHDYGNQLITRAWDAAQEKMYCCAVDTEGWRIYRESKWFSLYGSSSDDTGTKQGSEDQKPYVPRSCCIKDRFWRFIDTEMCQKWKLGPPGSPDNGAINRALYYEGCYNAAKRMVSENATILLTLMVIFALCLLCGAICSFLLIRKLRKVGR